VKPGLVILDPIMDFLDDNVDTYKSHNVQRVLAKFKWLMDELGFGIIFTRHTGKGTESIAHGGLGSVAFSNKARSRVLSSGNETTGYTLQVTKHNLSAKYPTLKYTIERLEVPVEKEDGTTIMVGTARVIWDVERTTQEKVDKEEKGQTRLVLNMVLKKPGITGPEVEKALGKSKSTANRILNYLVGKNLIRVEDVGKNTNAYYPAVGLQDTAPSGDD
jgi:RecA-family ATPase